MTHSEELDQLFGALAKFQSECPKITYDAKVNVKTKTGSYSFEYATLGHIINSTKDTLGKFGLAVTQMATFQGVQTLLSHESGQFILTDPLVVEPKTFRHSDGTYERPSPQELGSAITYSKRYQMAAILRVDADKDDDANLATGNTAEFKKSPVKSKPAPKPKPAPKKQAPTPEEVPDAPKPASNNSGYSAFLQEALDGKHAYTEIIQRYQKELAEADDKASFQKEFHASTQQAIQNNMPQS